MDRRADNLRSIARRRAACIAISNVILHMTDVKVTKLVAGAASLT